MQLAVLIAFATASPLGPAPLPNGYEALLAPPGSRLVIARETNSLETSIFRLHSRGSTKVAPLPGSDGFLSGTNFFVRQRDTAVLVVSSFLYKVTFSGDRITAEPKGKIEILPLKIGNQWLGSFYPSSDERKLFTLSSAGYVEVDEPDVLKGFSFVAGRMLYRVKLNSKSEEFVMGGHEPSLAQGSFRFGATVPWGSESLAAEWRIGREIGHSGYHICHKRVMGTQMARVWLCRLTSTSFQPLLNLHAGLNWSGEDFDESFVVGHRALLYVYDGNVTRSLWLLDLPSGRLRLLTNDLFPPSPTVTAAGVCGIYSSRKTARSTAIPSLYRLTPKGLSFGQLPKPWVEVLGTDEDGYIGQQTNRGDEVRSIWLSRFPTLRGHKWSIPVRHSR